MRLPLRKVLIVSNSNWCSGSQLNVTYLPQSSRRVLEFWIWSGIKKDSWFVSPRNDLTPVASVGTGNYFIALTQLESGLTPFLEIMYPANEISSPMTNFFLDKIMFAFSHREVISLFLGNSSGTLDAQMMMSSTSFRAQGRPSITTSERRHRSSEEAFRPWGILL